MRTVVRQGNRRIRIKFTMGTSDIDGIRNFRCKDFDAIFFPTGYFAFSKTGNFYYMLFEMFLRAV